jgi:hypothetical protein
MAKIEFQKVRNRELYLAVDDDGETVARIKPAGEGKAWQAQLVGGPIKSGFTSATSAQTYAEGYLDCMAFNSGGDVAGASQAGAEGESGEGEGQAGEGGAPAADMAGAAASALAGGEVPATDAKPARKGRSKG